jgi:DNA-binding response OmpR family regulator
MARILLVDDDEDILKLSHRLLSKNNHEVVVAKNGPQALEFLEKFSFDMVVLDANMPQMSGFEVLIKIRNHPQWKDLTVALLTGRKTKSDVQRALRLGVDDYIVKPIDPIIFLEKVDALLSKKEPNKWPQVDLSLQENHSQGKVELNLKIISVSELGLTLLTTSCPQEGDAFQVSGSLFTELQVESPMVKVIAVIPSQKPNEWIVKTHFFGVKDQFLQQIRSWMYQTLLRKAG